MKFYLRGASLTQCAVIPSLHSGNKRYRNDLNIDSISVHSLEHRLIQCYSIPHKLGNHSGKQQRPFDCCRDVSVT